MTKKGHYVLVAILIMLSISLPISLVKTAWTQNVKAEGSFKSADIGLNIDLNGENSDPAIVDLGTELVFGDNGTIALTLTNTGTVPEDIDISLPSLTDFLELTINSDECQETISVGNACNVEISWQITRETDSAVQGFDLLLTVYVSHNTWEIQKTVEIIGTVLSPTEEDTPVIPEIDSTDTPVIDDDTPTIEVPSPTETVPPLETTEPPAPTSTEEIPEEEIPTENTEVPEESQEEVLTPLVFTKEDSPPQ